MDELFIMTQMLLIRDMAIGLRPARNINRSTSSISL